MPNDEHRSNEPPKNRAENHDGPSCDRNATNNTNGHLSENARHGRRALQVKYKTYGRGRSVRLSSYSYKEPNVQYAITACCKNHAPLFTKPDIAKLVYDTFLEVLPNKGYKVLALCVMPDHLHVVMLSLENCIEMGRAFGAAKSLACYRAGRDVIRWQEKSNDHVVRCDEDIDNQIRYVINNPVRAELTDDWQKWPWTYVVPGSR